MNTRHLLLDIEGTTCPASFVSETLFPFARASLPRFVTNNHGESCVKEILKAAQHEWDNDITEASIKLRREHSSNKKEAYAGLIEYLLHLIKIDKKSTALKDLQGKIWLAGYEKGELKAEIFPETADCFQHWRGEKILISSYSSGSIQAQKLLYKNTKHGDLSPSINQWFDTHTGNKKHSLSYTKISQKLKALTSEILFISDNHKECDAARDAGMQTLFSLRRGNPDQNPAGHTIIRSLKEVVHYF